MSEIKTHTILVKGDPSIMLTTSFITNKFKDIRVGYGKIIFEGTDKEEDELLDYLVANEGKLGFKII